MHINTEDNDDLNKVWQKILNRMGEEGYEVCPNSSSFYKTQDGLECALRKKNGELICICYREKNRTSGYRWTIQKNF